MNPSSLMVVRCDSTPVHIEPCWRDHIMFRGTCLVHANKRASGYAMLSKLLNTQRESALGGCSRHWFESSHPSCLMSKRRRKPCSAITSGELYRLRRQMGIVEHWVYFSCNLLEWEAFDPIRCRWMHLPAMTSNECFMCSDKESLAAKTGTWETLPSMNKPRKLCSGVFMDGSSIWFTCCNSNGLTCGEVYDFKARSWTEVPDMFPARNRGDGTNDAPAIAKAPPLLAVVKNELYAAYYAENEVWKYDKRRNLWINIGRIARAGDLYAEWLGASI
ncbi:hypothetical protein HAX54_028131 [Datura stramonium]|uniref:F-box/kelch-repeat protein n=1 Tax=Datura stramonium TaxID=4076 RepID=A0ABS8S9D5_DATST|nr:hypothetical protein [Datura stramonium]